MLTRPAVIARSSATKQSSARPHPLDCFAAAQQQFILSDAAGGIEGLAMTKGGVE
jgi:hypothetical protein